MKLLKWVILFTIVFVSLYWVCQYKSIEEVDSGPEIGDEQPIMLVNPKLFDFQSDKVKWTFSAVRANIFQKRKLTFLYEINGSILHDDPAQKPTLVRADNGKIKNDVNLITISGNVRIDFDDGRKMFTEEIFIDQEKEIIYNQVDVLLISEQDTVNATSMRYDVRKGLLVLSKPRVEIEMDPDI